MNLHWHTAENPCLLCGVEVTPESWGKGVVAYDGEWGITEGAPSIWPPPGCDRFKDEPQEIVFAIAGVGIANQIQTGIMTPHTNLTPIFPPAGWAGKMDSELAREIWPVKDYMIELARGDGWDVSYEPCAPKPVICVRAGHIAYGETEFTNSATLNPTELADPVALILALPNALVLAARLGGAE